MAERDAIAHLRARLADTNRSVFRGADVDVRPIARVCQELTDWLGGGTVGSMPRDLLREALGRFFATESLEAYQDARLVSYALLERFGERPPLMEDERGFPLAIAGIDSWSGEPLVFPRLYRGLLACYFTYDPFRREATAVGQANWRILRTYLADHRDTLRRSSFQPDWAVALDQHANLLTQAPCDPYVGAALAGDRSSFADALARLNIGEASWVTHQYVIAQVAHVAKGTDSEFKSHLSSLLALLRVHPLACDTGLGMMVERYSAATTREAHPGLRDLSVERWGNPWLKSNRHAWALVTDDARSMIADWLKLEFIEQFFSLLAHEGTSDTRRLKFWQRYHRQIENMHFALGPTAEASPSPDFVELRRKMGDQRRVLDRPGDSANNAFIMTIGGHVVVEFGVKGNATYIFPASNLPFALDRREFMRDPSGWKAGPHVRLTHHDGIRGYSRWEDHFEHELRRVAGVRPDGGTVTPKKRPAATGPAGASPTSTPNTTPVAGKGAGWTSLVALQERFSFRIQDLRAKGGCLWVYPETESMALGYELTQLGFSFRPGRGWYQD